MKKHPGSRTGIVLSLIMGLGVGLTAAALVIPHQPPKALVMDPESSDQVAVVPLEFEDPIEATLELGAFDEPRLQSGVSGKVTEQSCVIGGQVKSGSSPIAVDNRPLLALSLQTPPWRSMTYGTKGPDVRALQKELRRLGYQVESTGTWLDSTRTAVLDLLRKNGITGNSGVLDPSLILWMPAPSLTVKGCDVDLGDSVQPDSTIITFTSTPATSELKWDNKDVFPGLRDFVAEDLVIRLDEDGMIGTDQYDQLLRLAANGGVGELGGTGNSGEINQVKGKVVLHDAMTGYQIPPQSVIAESNERCLYDPQGGVHRVRILGSSLGSSIVSFSETPPEAVILDPPKDAKCN